MLDCRVAALFVCWLWLFNHFFLTHILLLEIWRFYLGVSNNTCRNRHRRALLSFNLRAWRFCQFGLALFTLFILIAILHYLGQSEHNNPDSQQSSNAVAEDDHKDTIILLNKPGEEPTLLLKLYFRSVG